MKAPTENKQFLDDQRKAAALAEEQLRSDLAAVMSTPEGRRMISWLTQRCGVTEGAMVAPAPGLPACPLYSARQEGRRSVGIDLLRELWGRVPHETGQMLAEQADAQIASRVLRAAQEKPSGRSDTESESDTGA